MTEYEFYGGTPDELYKEVMWLGKQGYSELGMAHALGVSPTLFHQWKSHPIYEGLRSAIEIGIQQATDIIRQALFKRARGYKTYTEKKTTRYEDGKKPVVVDVKCGKEVPPNVGAVNLWLKLYANEEPAPRRRPGEKRLSDMIDQLNADMERRFAGYEKIYGPNWRETVFASEQSYLDAFHRLRAENPGDNFGCCTEFVPAESTD